MPEAFIHMMQVIWKFCFT